jgi:hypothetical protein
VVENLFNDAIAALAGVVARGNNLESRLAAEQADEAALLTGRDALAKSGDRINPPTRRASR